MADPSPQGVVAEIGGIELNGDAQIWRLVKARHDRNIGDVVNDPTRQIWNSSHNGKDFVGTFDAFEQIVTVAEQIAWTHVFSDGIKRDSGDVFIELMEFAIQWRKANNLPTSAK